MFPVSRDLESDEFVKEELSHGQDSSRDLLEFLFPFSSVFRVAEDLEGNSSAIDWWVGVHGTDDQAINTLELCI